MGSSPIYQLTRLWETNIVNGRHFVARDPAHSTFVYICFVRWHGYSSHSQNQMIVYKMLCCRYCRAVVLSDRGWLKWRCYAFAKSQSMWLWSGTRLDEPIMWWFSWHHVFDKVTEVTHVYDSVLEMYLRSSMTNACGTYDSLWCTRCNRSQQWYTH